MSLWLRRRIGAGVFLVGVLLNVIFVPMTICSGLGFRGTSTKNTKCVFQGYYFVVTRPTRPYSAYTQIRIDHIRLSSQVLAVSLLGLLVGFDYSRLTGRNKKE